MLKIIKKIWKNKLIAIFAFLIIVTTPFTLYKQSDKDRTIICSSIGIEKEEDEYKVTLLAVIPKSSTDVTSNLELYEGTGESISEALDKITFDLGRKIGLDHCDCILFNEKVLGENLADILDYFIRTANLTTNPTLVITPDKVKDLFESVKNSNNTLDLSLKNIITFEEELSLLQDTTLDRFYRAYLNPNSTFCLPIIEVQDEQNGGGSSGGSGGGSGGGNEDSSNAGGSSGGSGGQQQKKIKNDGDVGIVRNGKMIAKLSDEEKFTYTLLTKPSRYQKFVVKDISDRNVVESSLVFEESSKIIFPVYKFDENGKPYAEYNIWLSVLLDEVTGSNHSYASINGSQNFLTPVVEKKLREDIDNKLQNTIKLMQQNNYDVLGLYERFNAYKYSEFAKYLSTLEDPKDYMQDIYIKLNLNLNYVI